MGNEEGFEEKLEEIFSYGTTLTFKNNWMSALRSRAVEINVDTSKSNMTRGYKILFLLYSADIWVNNIPILKFIIAANIIVWIIGALL